MTVAVIFWGGCATALAKYTLSLSSRNALLFVGLPVAIFVFAVIFRKKEEVLRAFGYQIGAKDKP
jgi:hypothetical protein